MSSLPLPNGNGRDRRLTNGRDRLVNPNANRGLIFNKFVDRWHADDKGVFDLHEAKPDWIGCFCGAHVKAGEKTALETQSDRLAATARASLIANFGDGHPKADEQPIDLIAVGRSATGLGLAHPVENGFLWHHTLGVPYLPGSSVKGMIRAWAALWSGMDRESLDRLFGSEGRSAPQLGALIVFDALPTAPVELVTEILTRHDGGWRLKGTKGENGSMLSPGDWHDPLPVPYLAVEEGATFRFAIGATRIARKSSDSDISDVALGYQLLTDALDWIGVGAKTAVGLGRFKAPDAVAREMEAADRAVQQEKLRLAEEENRRSAELAMAREKAKEQWAPEVGQVIEYRLDGLEEIRVISALLPGGDFEATLPDGSSAVVTDKNESTLIAGSWEDFRRR